MTDQQLREQAVAHLKRTTITYSRWAANVSKGVYTPKDGSGTEWGQALSLLSQIGGTTLPPPPPPATVTNHLALIRYGVDLTSYATRIGEYSLVLVSQGDVVTANPRTLLYCDALTVNNSSGPDVAQFQSLGYSTGYKNGAYPGDFAKVGNSGYRAWFAQQVVAKVKARGAFGVFLDDLAMQPRITVGDSTIPVSDSSSPSCQQIFGLTLAQFQDAMVAVAAALGAACRQAGLYLMANCNGYVAGVQNSGFAEVDWIRRNAASLNCAGQESFMTLRDGSNTRLTNALGATSEGWATMVAEVEKVGLDFCGLTYGGLDNALYGYASVLTQAKRPGTVFMWGADTNPVALLGRYTGTASVDYDRGVGTVA